jgi:hypothetical protein
MQHGVNRTRSPDREGNDIPFALASISGMSESDAERRIIAQLEARTVV